LRAVHLILGFDPISKIFQEVYHTIKAGDPRINHIDVSKPDFLARDNLPPVILPVYQIPHPFVIPLQQVPLETATATKEEIVSSRLSLEEEIDQFHFEGEEGAPERPVQLSDSEIESDRLSVALQPKLVVARVDTSSEEKGGMDSKRRPSLKGLIANRNKGGTSKDFPRTQLPTNLPSPPPADLDLHAAQDLKKKRTVQELEEGEVALRRTLNSRRPRMSKCADNSAPGLHG